MVENEKENFCFTVKDVRKARSAVYAECLDIAKKYIFFTGSKPIIAEIRKSWDKALK